MNLIDGVEIIGQKPSSKIELAVIVLSYNQSSYLSTAVESVLAQEWQENWHILIHDDASSDNSASIIENYVNMYPNRITGFVQSNNKFREGVNILLELQEWIDCEYVARLDGDDYWISKNKLVTQIEVLRRNPNVALVSHPYIVKDQIRSNYRKVEIRRQGRISPDWLAKTNFIATPTVMYRANKVNPLPEKFTNYYIQDWPLWAVISSRGEIVVLNNIWAIYRIHDKNGFAGKSNRAFMADTLNITRMMIDFLPPAVSKKWRNMYLLRKMASKLDFLFFDHATTLLNKKSNYFLKLREESIPELEIRNLY